MTVRSYWASDIVNKLVYPTVPALLKNECPELYANYLKLIEGEKSNPLAVKQTRMKYHCCHKNIWKQTFIRHLVR